MSAAADNPQLDNAGGLSLDFAVGIIRKRKWMILGILLALPMAVGFVVSKQPKVYEASASLVIDASVPQYLGENFKDVVELQFSWWSAHEMLQTELRILRSHSQAVAVAKALCDRHLPSDTEPALKRLLPNASCNNPVDLARAAGMLQGMLTVDPVKDSRLVNLVVTAGNPELTAFIVNTFAEVYTQRNLERRMSQSEGAATWLGDEYGGLVGQLNQAEQALIEFKKKNNVVAVGIEDQQNDLSSRRKKLSDELNGVQVKLIALRAQREQYAKLKSDDPMNDVSPGVADSGVVQKLKELYVEQYAKLLELHGKYLDKHPAVISQQAKVDAVKADLVREAGLASKTVEAQFATALRQESELKGALDAATHEALQLEQRAIEYNRLRRNLDRLSKLSEQVGGRERETSLVGHLKTNNIRILDPALAPVAPISPNIPRAVGMSFVLALFISLGLVFLLEMLDQTIKTQDDIEKALGLVFLGLIPTIDPDGRSPDSAPPKAVEALVRQGSRDLYVLAYPKSSVAECCRAIRTNLLFMSPDKPAKSLLVTSAGPQEGKTTSAVNLAITLAQSGLRVLLVDTDMRRPRLHKAFGIPATADGLSKAMVGETDVQQMVRDTGVPNLWLLPCGATPPNPAELLHAERFKKIADQLEQSYDRVIFDSPPVGAVTDGAILARLTSGTILVAKGGRTSRDGLKRAKQLLAANGSVNILGCILNDLDLNKMGGYGYYYYSRYGTYYRENELQGAP
jgi:capsular exopolysaccharide synthesis family protein